MRPCPSVACILVNWNNAADTAACLTSLAHQDAQNLRVLVVDNGSTDGSLEQLRSAGPWVTYIDAGANLGFPRGCNLGTRHPLAASADFVWLLNNDTIVPPDTLTKLLATAADHPRAGVIGAVLHFMHDPASVQAWGGGEISRWTAYNRHYTAPTPLHGNSYITFASALIRRECFDQLQGLSEEVFMYFEDSDFCLRAQRAGWSLAVAAETAILHREGGTSKTRNVLLERISTFSGLVFLRRHAPVPLVASFLFLASRVSKRLLTRRWAEIPPVLRGAWDFLAGRSPLAAASRNRSTR
jgi:GT2 family glycosyltransferase